MRDFSYINGLFSITIGLVKRPRRQRNKLVYFTKIPLRIVKTFYIDLKE